MATTAIKLERIESIHRDVLRLRRKYRNVSEFLAIVNDALAGSDGPP